MKKIIILTFMALFLTGCGLADKNSGSSKTNEPVKKQAESYTFKALKAAIDLGIPLKCSYKINNFEYEGYLKGKNWRGKITQMAKVSNIIMKDNCMYAWSDDTPQGTKMCFEEDIWADSSDQQIQPPDTEYICVPSIVNDDQFTPPDSIEFMDLNDLNSLIPNMPDQMDPESLESLE